MTTARENPAPTSLTAQDLSGGESCAADATAERPRRLSISENMVRAVKRIAVIAREAAGCTQPQWAIEIRSTADVVKRIESCAKDDARRALNLHHLLAMPDSALDALMRELARVRLAHGFAARQWTSMPEILFDCDDERAKNLRREIFELFLAIDSDAPSDVLVKEAADVVEAGNELIASRILRIA